MIPMTGKQTGTQTVHQTEQRLEQQRLEQQLPQQQLPEQKDLFGDTALQRSPASYSSGHLGVIQSDRAKAVAKPSARTSADRDMQIAMRLAATLKGRGKYQKVYRAMTSSQRHRAGNAICEHLIASLKAQSKSQEAEVRCQRTV